MQLQGRVNVDSFLPLKVTSTLDLSLTLIGYNLRPRAMGCQPIALGLGLGPQIYIHISWHISKIWSVWDQSGIIWDHMGCHAKKYNLEIKIIWRILGWCSRSTTNRSECVTPFQTFQPFWYIFKAFFQIFFKWYFCVPNNRGRGRFRFSEFFGSNLKI